MANTTRWLLSEQAEVVNVKGQDEWSRWPGDAQGFRQGLGLTEGRRGLCSAQPATLQAGHASPVVT